MAAGGSKINLASAHRSPEDQERIYKTWKDAGGDLKTKPTAGGMTTPALPPSLGGSPNAHQLGVAIDAGQQAADINSKIKLSDYGLRWGGTFSNPDPVHIQMANFVPGKNAEPVKAFDGGVFSPKPGGVHVNLAEAGLREAAVPLNPGEKIRIEKSEQDNATPKKDPLSTVMASDIPTNSNQAAEILAALHDLMESKFDTMISALRDGNDITDKLLKYSQV